MSNFRSNARPRRRPVLGGRRAAAVSLVLASAATLAAGAAPAGAHGGDTQLVHSCIGGGGNVKIVAPTTPCAKNEVALDWPATASSNPYSAGSGLALTGSVFSVTGAPWAGLTGVPAGFADGTDDEGPTPTWSSLSGIPAGFADGTDDDGSAAASAAVTALRTSLAQNAGSPDQVGNLVSFSQIADLTTASHDGRITGQFIKDGSVAGADLADNSVDSDTVADGSIRSGDLAAGVLKQTTASWSTDLPAIPAGARAQVTVTDPFNTYSTLDLVTVSPPSTLDAGLVYAGSDVLSGGAVVVYLHNISGAAIDAGQTDWTIRRIRVGG